MRKSILNILIVFTIAIMVFATAILGYFFVTRNDFSNKITINANGTAEEVLEVTDLSLIPTESKDYEIVLVSVLDGNFFVTLDYSLIEDGGLGEFVDVTILVADEVCYEGKLNNLFETDSVITLRMFFESNVSQTIVITYMMDASVGNEAKGTFSDFKIKLTVKRNVGE